MWLLIDKVNETLSAYQLLKCDEIQRQEFE